MIECACGCGVQIPSFDKKGRKRYYKKGHHNRHTLKKWHGKFREAHPSWKGGRIINSCGYIMIYQQNHPYKNAGGYVSEHRLIMEQFLGRYLTPDENIHHKNGNRQDNRIDNLQLLNRSEHTRHHNLIRVAKEGVYFGINADRRK